MPKILDQIYRIQADSEHFDDYDRLILKMCANLLESHHEVKNPPNKLTVDEYLKMPSRFELVHGMLIDRD